MKFSLARPVLALAIMAALASCGGGGKATFPIYVTVSNLQYPGLVLTTNGQELVVNPPATSGQDVALTFPTPLEYGQTYEVIPKGATVTDHTPSGGAQPKHQTCSRGLFPLYGTAGQLARIDIRYVCVVNAYPLTGTINGLTGTGLVLSSGSNSGYITPQPTLDANNVPTGAAIPLTMNPITYGTSYGVGVVTQPTGQTCTVTGGANGNGSGTMDDAAEAAGGVTNLVVTCVKSSGS